MKKLVPATWLAFFSLLFFSCSKNNGPYAFAPEEIPAKLEAHIYPVVTNSNGEIVLGKEQSSLTVGETVTLFLPYRMVADDIQYGKLYISDAITGGIVRELEIDDYKAKKLLVSVVEIKGFCLRYALCEPHDL